MFQRFPGVEGSFYFVAGLGVNYQRSGGVTLAPIRTGVEVRQVMRAPGRPGFIVDTSDGVVEVNRVVVATGAFQRPLIPPIVSTDEPLTQIHSADYRNPGQLPDGAVLVVGAGSSGVQIADELQRSGRNVYLSVGPHDRPPRGPEPVLPGHRGQRADL